MLSSQLNLSSLTLSAKNHLVRFTSGGVLGAHLSSPSGGAPSMQVFFLSTPLQGPGAMAETVPDASVGSIGEFSLSGGGGCWLPFLFLHTTRFVRGAVLSHNITRKCLCVQDIFTHQRGVTAPSPTIMLWLIP